MFEIKTDRLRLIPLTAFQLAEWRKGRPFLEQHLGLKPSDMQISAGMEAEIEEALDFWEKYTADHPESYQWGTNWEIVLTEEQVSIGGIGMGGPPNRYGQVTVGYHIDVRRQRRGYAPEALQALRDWAMQTPSCTSMVAFTPVENVPSQKVLAKCGFDLIDQVEESGMDCFFWRYEADTT